MIFTDQIAYLETNSPLPRFFATSLTNEKNVYTYLHCLFIYEPITPVIVDASKARAVSQDFFNFIKKEQESNSCSQGFCFVPVVICIKSKHNFIDFFRKVLKSLYLHLSDISTEELMIGPAMKTMEFLKYAAVLLNDLIVPPADIQFAMKIGKHELYLPFESTSGMVHNESVVAILVDLIDIGNIIDFWEIMILNKHAFLMSSNEYLLFIIIEGFKSLLFPLTWTCNIIPVLSPHLVDFIECPVPILIGLNSTKVPKQTALSSEQDKVLLDIDSNTIYFKPISTICQCVKNNISKKLQLIKTYYYIAPQRLAKYRNIEMEKSAGNEDFVKAVRKLLEVHDPGQRENIFVDLVKQVFFSVFFEGLCEFEEFMKKDLDGKVYFDKPDFLMKQGFCKKCLSNEFWKNVVDTSNFEQFIGYYGKYDQSYVSKFVQIVKKVKKVKNGNGISPLLSPYQFNISSGMAPVKVLEILKNSIQEIIPENCEKAFKKQSAIEILKSLDEVLGQNMFAYEENEYNSEGLLRRNSFTAGGPHDSQIDFKLMQNTFYGKFGIIRCIGTIFALGTPEIFSQISKINSKLSEEIRLQTAKTPKKYEPMLLKLLYLIRQNDLLENYQELLNLLFFINNKCPELLPGHIAVFLLTKISKIDPDSMKIFSTTSGVLSKIAKALEPPNLSSSPVEKSYSKDDLLQNFRTFRTFSQNNIGKMHNLRI